MQLFYICVLTAVAHNQIPGTIFLPVYNSAMTGFKIGNYTEMRKKKYDMVLSFFSSFFFF